MTADVNIVSAKDLILGTFFNHKVSRSSTNIVQIPIPHVF